MSSLAIGTVQFGIAYGVANQAGQVPLEEARAILTRAKRSGVDTLDTAVNYGQSEERLGEIGVGDWRVISKLPGIPAEISDIDRWADELVSGSLQRLRITQLQGLLLHRPMELLQKHGVALFGALRRLRESGLVRQVGISIYEPSELDALLRKFRFDIVQGPFNLLDRRLDESGWMDRLATEGVEMHVRSVFLQGLLLMRASDRPKRFEEWSGTWSALETWRETARLTPLESCLRFVLSFPAVTKVIVGVERVAQLEEILAAAGGAPVIAPESLASADLRLINPSQWQS